MSIPQHVLVYEFLSAGARVARVSAQEQAELRAQGMAMRDAMLADLRAAFGSGLVPLELPLGEAESLHGIADVLSDQGYAYDASGHHHDEALPAEVASAEHDLHDEIAEEIVSGDDEQLERYLSGDVPSATDLERSLAHEVRDCLEFPVVLGSAITGVGVDRLADFLCELAPSPADRLRTVTVGESEVQVAADPAGDPLVYVFRTVADPFVGQVSLFKVLSGTISAEDHLVNTTTGTTERLHGLFTLRGKEHLPTDSVVAGDLAAVAKLSASPTGSALARTSTVCQIPCSMASAARFMSSVCTTPRPRSVARYRRPASSSKACRTCASRPV